MKYRSNNVNEVLTLRGLTLPCVCLARASGSGAGGKPNTVP